MKARRNTNCGYCREPIKVGEQVTRKYGCAWHTRCAVQHARRRAIAASGTMST